ncbi:MAG: DUF6152 family protein [Vicinamibacterales bacterium]
MKFKWHQMILACVVGGFLASSAVFAHHGNASFDAAKTVTLKGTVTEWLWANPHVFLKFDVKDEKGTVVGWNGVLGNPTDEMGKGYRRTLFKPGDQVEVTMHPSKSGAPVGAIVNIVLPNGQKF